MGLVTGEGRERQPPATALRVPLRPANLELNRPGLRGRLFL